VEELSKDSAYKVRVYTEITEDLKTLFERDYKEFVRDRRRWKGDFETAT